VVQLSEEDVVLPAHPFLWLRLTLGSHWAAFYIVSSLMCLPCTESMHTCAVCVPVVSGMASQHVSKVSLLPPFFSPLHPSWWLYLHSVGLDLLLSTLSRWTWCILMLFISYSKPGMQPQLCCCTLALDLGYHPGKPSMLCLPSWGCWASQGTSECV
jgi:hypothetical protein